MRWATSVRRGFALAGAITLAAAAPAQATTLTLANKVEWSTATRTRVKAAVTMPDGNVLVLTYTDMAGATNTFTTRVVHRGGTITSAPTDIAVPASEGHSFDTLTADPLGGAWASHNRNYLVNGWNTQTSTLTRFGPDGHIASSFTVASQPLPGTTGVRQLVWLFVTGVDATHIYTEGEMIGTYHGVTFHGEHALLTFNRSGGLVSMYKVQVPGPSGRHNGFDTRRLSDGTIVKSFKLHIGVAAYDGTYLESYSPTGVRKSLARVDASTDLTGWSGQMATNGNHVLLNVAPQRVIDATVTADGHIVVTGRLTGYIRGLDAYGAFIDRVGAATVYAVDHYGHERWRFTPSKYADGITATGGYVVTAGSSYNGNTGQWDAAVASYH